MKKTFIIISITVELFIAFLAVAPFAVFNSVKRLFTRHDPLYYFSFTHDLHSRSVISAGADFLQYSRR